MSSRSQDDVDDWIREARNMGEVYSHAYVNIAATDAINASQGLYRSHNRARACSGIVPLSRNHPNSYILYENRLYEELELSHLSRRAWTIQERFFARRTLHFASSQLYWECQDIRTSEGLPSMLQIDSKHSGIVDKPLLLRSENSELWDMWHKVARVYSKGLLTFLSDRPVAIAGLARTFMQLAHVSIHDYVHGMWRPVLMHELMWRTCSPFHVSSKAQSFRIRDIPSWSWLSIYREVYIADLDPSFHSATAQLVGIYCHPTRRDVFGAPYADTVQVRTYMCKVLLQVFEDQSQQLEDRSYTIEIGDQVFHSKAQFAIVLDDPDTEAGNSAQHSEVYLMLGRTCYAHHSPDSRMMLGDGDYECLLLRPSKSPGAFERRGFVEFREDQSRNATNTSQGVRESTVLIKRALDNHFLQHNVPTQHCEAPDAEHMYTFALV